jgi:hypothetical protein
MRLPWWGLAAGLALACLAGCTSKKVELDASATVAYDPARDGEPKDMGGKPKKGQGGLPGKGKGGGLPPAQN